MKTSYVDNSKLAAALGLQPGEGYEQTEECHTHETAFTFCGRKVEVWFDEMAGPFSQWNAFSAGIGTKSGLERADVIARIKTAIRSENFQ